MGAEFFGELGQSFENVSRDAFRQQQIINDRQEALDALEISNNFEIDLGAQELEARNNYQFDGKYTEDALRRFEEQKQKALSGIKNDRVKRRVSENLEKYKGQFQLSNLAFQNGAQQIKQKEQYDDALSIELGSISINPNTEQVKLSQEKLFQTVQNLPPEERIKAEQEIKDSTFQMRYDTLASNAIEGYSTGTLTREGLTGAFDGILQELSSSKSDLSSSKRAALIQSYQNKKNTTLKNLRAINKAAATNKWNAVTFLQSENRRELTEDDLNNYLQFLDNDTDKQVAQMQYEISKQKGALLDDINSGDRDSALQKIQDFKNLSDQAIANNDPVKATQYATAANTLQATFNDKFKQVQESVIDAFPYDTELKRQYEDDLKGFVTNAVTKAQSLGIRPDSTNFLTKQDREQAISILTSGDFDGIKQYFRDLEQKWNFQHESLSDGNTPYESILGDIIADKRVPNNVKGFLMYGMQKDYGNLIMDLSRLEVPEGANKAYGKSSAAITEKVLKKLKPYAKALANSGDFQSSGNFIALNSNVISDLAFKSAFSPKVKKALGLDSSLKDAIDKITEITIEANYDISKDAQGNDILINKQFANDRYKQTLADPVFFESFVKDSISPKLRLTATTEQEVPTASLAFENVSSGLEAAITTKADAEYALKIKKDITELTPEDRARVVYQEVFADTLVKQILDSGSFRPVQNTSRARLYVDYGGQSFPLSLNGEYFEIGSSDEELLMAEVQAPTRAIKREERIKTLSNLSLAGR